MAARSQIVEGAVGMVDMALAPLRLDPAVHDALARWAGDELRSLNAHIELRRRRALDYAGWMPAKTGPLRARGRPRRHDD